MTRSFMAALATATIMTASCSKEKDNLQHYQVAPEQSSATWKGYLRTGYFNEGTIAIESATVKVKDGVVSEGTFVMPLYSLKNLNLPDDQKSLLIEHLQSPDFFNMVMHPSLKFTIAAVTEYKGPHSGAIAGANYYVTGDLSMLGTARQITFPARIALSGHKLEVDADITIDRTQWGMNYAADEALPDEHFIKHNVDIHLHLAAEKSK
jgi:polyisoprenoid-binding protein YceI